MCAHDPTLEPHRDLIARELLFCIQERAEALAELCDAGSLDLVNLDDIEETSFGIAQRAAALRAIV